MDKKLINFNKKKLALKLKLNIKKFAKTRSQQ